MKLLVTGANGLLGQKLVLQAANRDGVSVVATSRGPNRQYDWVTGYQYASLDLTDADACLNLFEKERPDVVIHTAAMTQVDACEQDHATCDLLNIRATEHVIAAAKINKARLIHLSTDFVFDGQAGPYDESDAPHPISYYGASKLKSEELVAASGLSHAIARTVLVYGQVHAMSRSNIVLWVKDSLENNKPIRVVTDQVRSPRWPKT